MVLEKVSGPIMPKQSDPPGETDSPDRLRARAARVRRVARALLDDRAVPELLRWADELETCAAALEAARKLPE